MIERDRDERGGRRAVSMMGARCWSWGSRSEGWRSWSRGSGDGHGRGSCLGKGEFGVWYSLKSLIDVFPISGVGILLKSVVV